MDDTRGDVHVRVDGMPGRDIRIDAPPSTRTLHVEIKEPVRPVTISGIPPNLKELYIGPLMAESLVGPLDLPWALETYRGPVFHDTVLPLTLKKMMYVQSFSSVPVESIYIPTGVEELTIVTNTRVSSVDSVSLPGSVHTVRIEGPFNASLEKLDTANVSRVVLPKNFSQPIEVLDNAPLGILDGISVDAPYLSDGIPVIRGKRETDHLVRYLPSLNHLRVMLNDEILDLVDVWTRVLFEGRVRVRNLVVDAGLVNYGTDILRGVHIAIDRAVSLGRPVCRHLFVQNIVYNCNHLVSYYKLAQSLTRLRGIDVVLSHRTPVPDLSSRLADIMGLTQRRYDETLQRHVYYKLFGAIATEVYVSGCDTIHIIKGQGARLDTGSKIPYIPSIPILPDHHVKTQTNSAPEPSSSSSITHTPEPDSGTRPIILYSWTECGYCKKQEDIIQSFKETSGSEDTTFDDIVEVRTITDPSDIADKRIVSFPTWVTGDTVSPGVKDAEGIKDLIRANV